MDAMGGPDARSPSARGRRAGRRAGAGRERRGVGGAPRRRRGSAGHGVHAAASADGLARVRARGPGDGAVVQYRADNQDPEVSGAGLRRRSCTRSWPPSWDGRTRMSDRSIRGSIRSRRWYRVRDLPCSAPCEVFGVVPTLDIEVVQPARRGEGGIWSVATVRSADLRHPAPPPATHRDQARSAAPPGRRTGLHTLAGAQWYDGCDAGHDIVDEVRRPSRFEITLPDPAATASSGCGSVAAGYAYAYAVERLQQPVGRPPARERPPHRPHDRPDPRAGRRRGAHAQRPRGAGRARGTEAPAGSMDPVRGSARMVDRLPARLGIRADPDAGARRRPDHERS